MLRRPKRGADGEMVDSQTSGGMSPSCQPCLDPDPQVRYSHYLTLARQMDFDGIESHLWQTFRERKNFDHDRARDTIDGLMYWLKDQVLSFSNMVDSHTGAKLTWWEARHQVILALRRSTEQKAQAADAKRLAREQSRFPRRPADTLLRMALDTTELREPGEEAIEEEIYDVAD